MGIKVCLTSGESQAIAWFLSRCKTMIYSVTCLEEHQFIQGWSYIWWLWSCKNIYEILSLLDNKNLYGGVCNFCLFYILLLDMSMTVCLSIYLVLSILSVYQLVSICLHLSIYPFIHLSVCPSVCLFICLSVYLSVCSSFHIFTSLTSYINGWLYYIKRNTLTIM